METIQSELVIVLRDLIGARLVADRSGAVIKFATDQHGHLTAGISELEPGKYQLGLEIKGRPRLHLRLRAAVDGGELSLEFAGPKPRCCALKLDSERRTTLTITLAATHEELIFVSGWDYSGGSDTRRWCETWRDDLYAGETYLTGKAQPIPKQIHDHTVVTLFDFRTGERVQLLKAEDGWHELDRSLQGEVATHLEPYKDPAATQRRHDDDSISIVHVYAHITALGCTSPGSVVGLHVFSHAWAGGPILVNTNQTPRYAYSPQRDPGDKDGRTKDFTIRNMPRLEQFAAAFAPTAIAKIWGCFATTFYRRMVRAAARADDPDEQLSVRVGDQVRTLSAAQIETEFRETIIGDSYMARLGRAAGIRVLGAPPGMGANFKRVGKRYYMFVKPRVYGLEYRWYAETLGLEADISGHFAYTEGTPVV